MKKLLISIIILFIASTAYARPVVLPKGGSNDWPVVRSGDGRGELNMFRYWGSGEHDSIMIFNDAGDTATLPKDYFSPLQHAHVVADFVDFNDYIWLTCIYSDASDNATEAAHTQDTETAKSATNADESAHGITGVHAKLATFSEDAYPAKAGLYETMVWNSTGIKWQAAATITPKTKANALFVYDKDGNCVTVPISEIADKYSVIFQNVQTWTAAGGIIGGIIFVFALVMSVIYLVMRWTGYGDYEHKITGLILMIMFLPLLSVNLHASMPEAEGKDGYIVCGKDGTVNYQFLNDPTNANKLGVILGYNATGETDFTKISTVSKNPHKHVMERVTDKDKYKMPSVAKSETCADCALADKAKASDTVSHCITATEGGNCLEADKAKVSAKAINGLPTKDLHNNDTMAYNKESKLWIGRTHQIPFDFKRNSFLGTDKDKKWMGYDISIIIGPIDKLAQTLQVRNYWFLGVIVLGIIVMIILIIALLRVQPGVRMGAQQRYTVDGQTNKWWISSIDTDGTCEMTRIDYSPGPRKYLPFLLVAVLMLPIFMGAIKDNKPTSPYFPPLPDHHGLTKAGPAQEDYDFHYQDGNVGKQNVYRGFDKDSNTAMIQKDSYAPDPHDHTIAHITNIAKYKAPNGKAAEKCGKCTDCAHAKAAEEATTCDAAGTTKHCVLIDRAERADYAENGLPAGDNIEQNSIMAFTGVKWETAQEAPLPNATMTVKEKSGDRFFENKMEYTYENILPNALLSTNDKGVYITRTIDDIFGELKKNLENLSPLQFWLLISFSIVIGIMLLALIYAWWIPHVGTRVGDLVRYDFRGYGPKTGVYKVTKRNGNTETDPIEIEWVKE